MATLRVWIEGELAGWTRADESFRNPNNGKDLSWGPAGEVDTRVDKRVRNPNNGRGLS